MLQLRETCCDHLESATLVQILPGIGMSIIAYAHLIASCMYLFGCLSYTAVGKTKPLLWLQHSIVMVVVQ